MKRWIERLHGAQVLMLLCPVWLVSAVTVRAGWELWFEGSRFQGARDYPFLYKNTDTLSAVLSSGFAGEEVIGSRIMMAGVCVGLITVVPLWWWFGGRAAPRGFKNSEWVE